MLVLVEFLFYAFINTYLSATSQFLHFTVTFLNLLYLPSQATVHPLLVSKSPSYSLWSVHEVGGHEVWNLVRNTGTAVGP